MVRLAVRPSSYGEQLRKQFSANGQSFYLKDIAPGFVAIAVLDFSRTLRYLTDKDLGKLALGEDQVFQLAEKNLRSTSKPLSEVTPVPGANSLGTIVGEDYAASRILFHDDWKNLSSRLNNKLLVMLPAPDILVYGDGSTSEAVDALRTFGTTMARRSPRPLSLSLLLWTESGWEIVK